MEALTKKQQAILDYMRQHVAELSYWPSIRDIQAKFRFASTNAVFGHLQALERKGVLQRIPGAARTWNRSGRSWPRPAARSRRGILGRAPDRGLRQTGLPSGTRSGPSIRHYRDAEPRDGP